LRPAAPHAHDPAVTRSLRGRPWPLALAVVVALAIAVPAFGADPSPSASPLDESPSASVAPTGATSPAPAATKAPAATPKPTKEPEPDKAVKPERGPKTPKVTVSLRGTVAAVTDGRWPAYTLTSGGKTYRLSAGPPWWWGEGNPLAKAAGKTVTIGGEQATGSDEIDVLTIDGVAIREPGRPPWAGGPKIVGDKHPGWAQWKADKWSDHPGRGLGRDDAPGQQTP
jgi:septal ring-binding cell division protein DamX